MAELSQVRETGDLDHSDKSLDMEQRQVLEKSGEGGRGSKGKLGAGRRTN